MSGRVGENLRHFTNYDFKKIVQDYDQQCKVAIKYIKRGKVATREISHTVDHQFPPISFFACCCGYPNEQMNKFLQQTLDPALQRYGSVCRGYVKAQKISDKLKQLPQTVQLVLDKADEKKGSKKYQHLSHLSEKLWASFEQVDNAVYQLFNTARGFHNHLEKAYGSLSLSNEFNRYEHSADETLVPQTLRYRNQMVVAYGDHYPKLHAALSLAKLTNPDIINGETQPSLFGQSENPETASPVNLKELKAHLTEVIQNDEESEEKEYGALELEQPLLPQPGEA